MTGPGVVRWRLRISGRVQGVGYRAFVRRAAAARAVAGFVTNLPDGSVACEVEGPEPVLAELVAELRQGPLWGRVDELEREPVPPLGETGFRIR